MGLRTVSRSMDWRVHCTGSEWLEFEIGGPATLVTGLVTRGRGDGRRKHWVTHYRLSYSNDSQRGPWHFYQDAPNQPYKVHIMQRTAPRYPVWTCVYWLIVLVNLSVPNGSYSLHVVFGWVKIQRRSVDCPQVYTLACSQSQLAGVSSQQLYHRLHAKQPFS